MKPNKQQKPKKEKKNFVKSIFAKFFGFETGLDLTDDIAVLKRKNQVIKNIIFLLNIFFFIMMMVYSSLMQFAIGSGNKVSKVFNWIITGATFPLTFLINFFLKKLIKKGEAEDRSYNLAKQQIAMYFAVVYLFIATLIFYLKINIAWENNQSIENPIYRKTFEAFSYVMFYLALLVCSFYHDKKLMFNASLIMFAVLCLVHFFLTHNMIGLIKADRSNPEVWKSNIMIAVSDIVLRSLVFILYSAVLYSVTAMSYHVQSERKKELLKRKNVESDFKIISNTIIDFVKMSPSDYFAPKDVLNVLKIENHLATLAALNNEQKNHLEEFSQVHLRASEIISQEDDVYNFMSSSAKDSSDYHETLKDKTVLGTMIIRRVQLTQKAEQLIRSYVEKSLDFKLIENNGVKKDLAEDIVLLSEIYYRLRSPQKYKEPYRHQDSIEIIKNNFFKVFDENLINIFLSFEQDFNEIYLNL